MLAGSPPFTGSTPQAILARHLADPVPPLRTVRRSVPLSVEQAILRALEKVPADRYATVTQFADALERSEEHTSELQSRQYIVCRLLLEKNEVVLEYVIRGFLLFDLFLDQVL